MRSADPPRLARWLLERFGTASRLHSLLGDLAEEYANGRSGLWYWRQALGTVALDFIRALRTRRLSVIVAVITGARRRDRIREDAFTWLARLSRGLRAAESSELLEWLKRRSHRAYIARAAAHGDSPEVLAVLSEIFLFNPEWVDSRQRRSPAINALAALTAAFIAALPLLYTHHYVPGLILGPVVEGSFADTMSTVYASDRHTLRRVVLADGTRIVMNRGTRIVVLGSSVQMTRGEATFTVARRAPGRFELTADDRRIGTTSGMFDVCLPRAGAMELTVLEGTVTVFPSRANATANRAALREGEVRPPVPTLLNADQALYTKPGTESVKALSQPEVQARIAWQRG